MYLIETLFEELKGIYQSILLNLSTLQIVFIEDRGCVDLPLCGINLSDLLVEFTISELSNR